MKVSVLYTCSCSMQENSLLIFSIFCRLLYVHNCAFLMVYFSQNYYLSKQTNINFTLGSKSIGSNPLQSNTTTVLNVPASSSLYGLMLSLIMSAIIIMILHHCMAFYCLLQCLETILKHHNTALFLPKKPKMQCKCIVHVSPYTI